ncbi:MULTISPECIES: prepilin peptidase [unclassified Methanobrevibacter]|uniref:A24 family peptidase n=1 Tax=unclassified Methanobrevibacter TaxID=2638681 RepID=UPI001D9FC53B|nr:MULTISPECIES: A24 family peptidase [unclassified Methanobrevibacter]MBE6492227.1 prepilin peptidase [Methanobrevibacter sp.]MEE0942902.1 A24 family peptidase [Methanobrevibacter sp.]
MNFSLICLFQISITVLFCIMAAIFDVKDGIIPNWLTRFLLIFGFISNLILSLFSSNIKYILASIISVVITYFITYMMWQLNIWGGGDVKLFTGISSVIPFGTNVDFLDIFPQLSIYPFSFSVVLNSILVSFPFLIIFVTYLIFKNNIFKENKDFLFNLLNINSVKYLIESTLNKMIPVKDICEGAIVNEYYFNNEHICHLINEIGGNLKVYKNEHDSYYKYYFKSQSAGGITEKEMYLLKIMNAQGFISDEISVKISFPFAPAILFGLMVAVIYGDIIMLFTKNIFLVV